MKQTQTQIKQTQTQSNKHKHKSNKHKTTNTQTQQTQTQSNKHKHKHKSYLGDLSQVDKITLGLSRKGSKIYIFLNLLIASENNRDVDV